ncbi:hypothetical protein GCM10020218_102290 [Dactylosporangium vinaceum]
MRRYGAADAHLVARRSPRPTWPAWTAAGAPASRRRERRIVELVRAGATNREIARALFLSIKAVEANLTRLYRPPQRPEPLPAGPVPGPGVSARR